MLLKVEMFGWCLVDLLCGVLVKVYDVCFDVILLGWCMVSVDVYKYSWLYFGLYEYYLVWDWYDFLLFICDVV